jgi:DNA-binding beta-propeller fold protein YncE
MRELAPGVEVAGYRIDSLVGRGGMGVVYRAVQLGLDRVVALKVIAPELLDEDDVRARFLEEARAAASVDHPNVIPVHAAGEDAGVAYIAMRFVAGDDVRSLVRRSGPLDPAEAADLVAQAGAALDAIHRAGFVHRDVKPANLLVDRDGHVYLTDFGLAKAVLTRSGGTRTGHWVGTLDYVSPEQIRGGRIDARADVYALGGVLHYALTGRVPFEREGDEAKLWAQLSAPPPVPSALRRGLPGQFDAAVARAMAKHPDERFPSAGDLGRAARAAALGRAPAAPERVVARGAAAPGGAPEEPGLAAEADTHTARPRPAPLVPRRRRAPLLAAAGAVAVAAVVTVLLLRPSDPEETSAARDAVATPTPTPTATATVTPTPTATATPFRTRTTRGIGDRPSGIALAGGDLWIASTRQPWLTRVSAATGRERRAHPKIGRDITAIVSYRGSVWLAVGETGEVVRVDGRTGKVRTRIRTTGKPRRLAVASNGVWVGTDWERGGAGQLLHYDFSGRLRQTLVVNEGVGGLVATADALWVIKSRTYKVARLLPGSDVLQDWAALPSPAHSMSYGRGALWVTMQLEDAVARIDVDGPEMVTAAAGHSPAHSVMAGGRLWVAARNDHSVVILDPESLVPIAEPVRVGLNPFALVADRRSVWVTSLGESTLTRIDYR